MNTQTIFDGTLFGHCGRAMYSVIRCYLVTEIACRTNSSSIVLGFHVGLMADRPFYQTAASVLFSDQALSYIFLSIVMFLLRRIL